MSGGVARFSASVDPGLLKEFDVTLKALGYSRSSAIQVAIRDFLTEHNWKSGTGDVIGAITILYDHNIRGLGEVLTDIQHDHHDAISSTTHVHLDHNSCLEIVAVRGSAGEVDELAKSLAAARGVKQIKISILTI